MPGDGRLDSRLSRIVVSNLTDHHYIRVETKDGPHIIGESLPMSRIDRNLSDTRDVELYRILQGENLAAGVVKSINDAK